MLLRILGFFSSSFSRKLHHPQGSLSVLMTGNFKKPNQLFSFSDSPDFYQSTCRFRSTSLYPSTGSKVPVHHRMKSGVKVPPPKPGETKVQPPETMNIGEVTPPGKKDPEKNDVSIKKRRAGCFFSINTSKFQNARTTVMLCCWLQIHTMV